VLLESKQKLKCIVEEFADANWQPKGQKALHIQFKGV